MTQRILRRIRSEEDKETRRRWGDRSGRCRFSKTLAMGGGGIQYDKHGMEGQSYSGILIYDDYNALIRRGIIGNHPAGWQSRTEA